MVSAKASMLAIFAVLAGFAVQANGERPARTVWKNQAYCNICAPFANTVTFTSPATSVTFCAPIALTITVSAQAADYISIPDAPTANTITVAAGVASTILIKAINLDTLTLTTPSATTLNMYLTAPNATFTYVQSSFGKTQSIDAHLASPVVVDAPQTLTFTVNCAEFGQIYDNVPQTATRTISPSSAHEYPLAFYPAAAVNPLPM
ncbi:MAG: hypothetical protein WDW38_005936 [Sanguina aurantia]